MGSFFELKTQIWRFEKRPHRFREPREQKIEDFLLVRFSESSRILIKSLI